MEANYDNYEKTLADNQFIGGYVPLIIPLKRLCLSNAICLFV